MRYIIRSASIAILVVMIVACAGPDDRDDADPTAISPAVETPAADSTEESTPPAAQISATATSQLATPTTTATSEPTPTRTPVAPTATLTPAPTATSFALGLEASMPSVDQLPDPGYFLANQGSLSALDLANSYSEPSAHLERLNEWGFKEHLFREFSRESSGAADPLPTYILTTVNEYGSSEQAGEAMDWLRSLNGSQGHEFVDPPPELGDLAMASTVSTAEGVPSAIVFVQLGSRVYAYFAQGGDALTLVLDLARVNTQRILDAT